MKIPFLNLKYQYDLIRSDIDSAIRDSFGEFQFCKGSQVNKFEKTFSQMLKSIHCISTGNGTDALFISLKTLGIRPGDEVLTPAFSWISSAETITLCGGIPVFVDIDPETYTIDPLLIEKKITPKTRAILAVHLFGQAADLTALTGLLKTYDLMLVEDCAQAHLSEDHDQVVGTFGNAGAFSFYPTKNLGAYGDAGCIVTADDVLAEKMRRFANHGALKKDDHLIEGMNSRMDTIQASVLLAKVPYLKHWNEKRSQHAQLYDNSLSGIQQIVLPYVRPKTRHTFHIYAIRAKKRNQLQQYLLENGIQTLVHYPSSLPILQAYKYLNHKPGDFPVADRLPEEIISLPIYPELTPEQIFYICEKIKDFYRKHP